MKYTWQGLNFLFFFLMLISFLFGCASSNGFQLKDLAKSNLDEISEIHLNSATKLVKALTVKLYKKNPYELQKGEGKTVETRMEQIFNCDVTISYEELNSKKGTQAILLGFEPDYKGDRVFALMYGLYTMILQSYNNKCELYITDSLNQQILYNCARNIEIMVWRLKTKHKKNGNLLILTNSFKQPLGNLSYERIFGKLISLQDTMAIIISKRTNRVIKEVVQMAGMTFLPIGL